jgi:hypothetical protein
MEAFGPLLLFCLRFSREKRRQAAALQKGAGKNLRWCPVGRSVPRPYERLLYQSIIAGFLEDW